MKANKQVREYLRQIGAKGGKKARHYITPEKQKKMQAARKTTPENPAERREKMILNFKTWELSTEHATCSYGQPVLVNRATGEAYGAGDIVKPYPSWSFMPGAMAVRRMAAAATLTPKESDMVEQFVGLLKV